MYGLTELPLLNDDAPKLDRLYWRLINATQYGREASTLISASPAAVVNELIHTIATVEGDAVVASTGLSGHCGALREMIRVMAEDGSDSDTGAGGIADGDIFTTNDPLGGSSQSSDMYTVLPIFYAGELVAWAAASLHVIDIGTAITTGTSPWSPTTYTDGFIIPPTKTGQGFVQSKSWERTLRHRTRYGVLNVLDDKMRLVGDLILRDRVLEIIEDFGVDYFVRGMRELLERERRAITAGRRRLEVPSVSKNPKLHALWQKAFFAKVFPEAAEDRLFHLPVKCVIKADGSVTHDYRGGSSQFFCTWNCYPGGYNLSAYVDFPSLSTAPTMSAAIYNVVEHVADPGTLMNPDRTDLSSQGGCAHAIDLAANATQGNNIGRFARGFLEECWINEMVWQVNAFEGAFADGTPFNGGDFSSGLNMPLGAGAYRDGIPAAQLIGSPVPDMGEVEEFEFLGPAVVFIQRGLMCDLAAHGKYRSAPGMSQGMMVVNPGGNLTMSIGYGPSEVGYAGTGMLGGYPMNTHYLLLLSDTNAKQLIDRGVALPRDFSEAREMIEQGILTCGRVRDSRLETPLWEMSDGDLLYWAGQAGSSWGEPLDRDPELVGVDVARGWLSVEVARGVYGVEVADVNGEWKIDEARTADSRRALKRRRKERAIPVSEWWREEREKVLTADLSELHRVMYKDCLQRESFRTDFLPFWALPDDYADRL